MTESQFKKMVQIITAAAVVLLLVLAVVIVVLFGTKAAINRNIDELNELLKNLDKQAVNIQEEIEYRQSLEYIENYAREMLGMIKQGEIKFVARD